MNEEIILNVETNSPYVIGAVAYVEQLENGAKITIVDKNGTTTATVYDGNDGKSISSITLNDDYTLTILYTDGDTTTTSSIRGATGASGVFYGEEEPIDPAINVWVDPADGDGSVLKIRDEDDQWTPIESIVGEPAGFGTVTATVDANHGTPAVTVTTSGDDTAKNFAFAFSNLQPAPYDDSELQADFAVLQGQFDTAVAAVTTDTEVTDIRVGADGITDTTAGASVRRQFTDLKSDLITAPYDFAYGSTWGQGAWVQGNDWENGSLNGNGTRVGTTIDLGESADSVQIYLDNNDYSIEYYAFDSNHASLGFNVTWQDSYNLTLKGVRYIRIDMRKDDNSAVSPNIGKHLRVNVDSVATAKDSIFYTDSFKKMLGSKQAIILPQSDKYVFEFNTSNHTVKINASYLYLLDNVRISISQTTIDYYPINPPGISNIMIVYDVSDSSIKAVYGYNTTNGFNANTQYILCSFIITNLPNGMINTDAPYKIDSKYEGNISSEIINHIEKIKVCSYNVGMYTYGLPNADYTDADVQAKCRKFFASHPFDIVGLQENRVNLHDTTIDEAVYDYLYPNSYGYDRWAWFKTPYDITYQNFYAFSSATPGDGRPYVVGNIQIGDKNVYVVVVHFALNPTDRATNYAELLSRISGHEYVIVLGDFNAGVGGGDVQTEFNTMINAGYKAVNGGYLGLMETTHAHEKIDNIFVSDNITISNSYVLDVYDEMCSDHLPIVAELIIN